MDRTRCQHYRRIRRTRTTWARGVWKQHAYNDRNLVSGTTYSDATPSVSYSYADSGKVASATIAGGTSYAYAYDEHLLNTNEAVMVGGDAFTVARTYDDHWRACETSVLVTNVPHAAKTRLYDSEDRVCGYALTNSAGRGLSVALSYDGSYLTNMFYTLPGGSRFSAQLTREPARKELVTNRAYAFNGSPIYSYSTDYDLIGRPTNAVDSLSSVREWLYNRRSELTQATVGTNLFGYAYDTIGNRNWDSSNAATNNYTANNLNQYTCLDRTIEQSEQSNNLSYDADGNLTSDGRFTYVYDAENRLVSVTSAVETNGAIRVLNAYDHRNRRVRKTVQRLLDTNPPPPSTPTGTRAWQTLETRTFVWDGMNIVLEVIVYADGTESVVEYFWGSDKSGTEQGAGGVGGLLAVSMGGQFYIPCYDHNGNIVCYVAENGSIAGQYLYDPYGNVLEQYGPMPEDFNFGFSTKYHDREIGMVGYQRRFYRPDLGRWLNRDPIEENGGANLYLILCNNTICFIDIDGLRNYAIGLHGEPRVTFDNDFPYDQNAKPSVGDYWNWAKWKTKLGGAKLLGHLEDATILYSHYLDGSGTAMDVDYEKAYREDSGIATSVRNAVREAQRAAETLAISGGREFTMSSDAGAADKYPVTENWQKAIGGHSLWGEATVRNCNEMFSMDLKIHALDKYNFNRGAADIVTGAPDNENGRFEVLGWAKSFVTRGVVKVYIKWKRGSVGDMEIGSEGRSSLGRSRERGR